MNPSLRAVRPLDLDGIHALHRRVEEHDHIPMVTSREGFESWLDDPHLDMARDTRLAEAGDAVVAWGRILHRPSGEREERAFLQGAVDPAHRRRGIGSVLLQWQIERSREILVAASGTLPRFVRAQAYDFESSAQRLYARHGMTPVRYGEEMLRSLDTLPEQPSVEGIAIVRWDPARSEEARIAQNDAFADHWGSTPRDRATWEHGLASYGSRLDLSFLALEGTRVVGVCRNGFYPGDEALNGRREGWILELSVVRSHRKRGIASALIVASLEAFKHAGLTHSALGVDSENPTGARHLYERLGYRPMHRSVVYQRAV